jgi:excisionase family DNA binding protein
MRQMSTDESGLLTVKETAKLLRVSPATVGRWIARGRLKACRLPGGTLRVAERDIRTLREAKVAPPGSWEGWTVIRLGDPNVDPQELAERLKHSRAKQLAERGGIPYSDSAPIIREAREEWAGQQWPDDE